MENDEKYCWACGEEDDLVFIPDVTCVQVISGRYVCKDCCIKCVFLPECKFRGPEWFKTNKKSWEIEMSEIGKAWLVA